MKRLQFASLLFFATMLLLFSSCGGGDSKTETTADSTTAETTTPAAPPEVNTIITTPQNMMVARHKVANFAKWKASYDEHDSLRLANGIHSYVIGRGVENDSNTVLVAVKIDDLDKAKAFAKDPSLKKAMQKGGVIGTPQFNFVTAVWQDTAVIGAAHRSMTTFTIKDWDAWKKSFDEGKQDRDANGIAVRMVGHDADDNKKVALVTALLDTAKAHAYWKSDALKKRREAGGVTSEPKRFVFYVVQRY